MLYARSGYPERDEIVLCKVTKLFPSSVFVELLEYGKPGLVHISEVSPGRIRNLRDYVSIGRQIVCKVLRVDREKGHIDLSLRRVNSHQRQDKLDEIKQESKAESLVKNLAKKLNLSVDALYKQLTQAVFNEYSHLYLCFKDVVDGKADLEKLGIEQKIAQEIKAAVIEKFKPLKITLQGEIRLRTYDSDGINKIKFTLSRIEQISPTINLFYLGAGRYKLTIEDEDYKPAEKTLSRVQEELAGFNDKISTAQLEREND